jgi:hypothetical protein
VVTFSAKNLDGSGCGLFQQRFPAWTEGFSLEQSVCGPRIEQRTSAFEGNFEATHNHSAPSLLLDMRFSCQLLQNSTVIWGVTPYILVLQSSKTSICFYQATRLHIRDVPIQGTVITSVYCLLSHPPSYQNCGLWS